MTTKERFVKVLTGEKVDRVPFIKVFGGTNAMVPDWEDQCPGISNNIDEVLGFEGQYRGWQITPVNVYLSQVGKPEILEENEEKIVQRFSNGTVEVIKKDDFAKHTLEYPVKSRSNWERIKKEHLNPDDRSRFPENWDELVGLYNQRDYPLQLTHLGVYGFARLMMGDENLAYAFYDDPDMVHDIMDTYTDMAIKIWEKMCVDVQYDLIECWEDMASKNGSLVSPKIIEEFMKPNYLKIKKFADENGIKIVLVDCDGYIEDLVGILYECGVNAFYPFEAQAGNDLEKVLRKFPGVSAIGGLNKNVMAGTKEDIDRELAKLPELLEIGRFIPGPDHFVLSDVKWENYKYFMKELKKIILNSKK